MERWLCCLPRWCGDAGITASFLPPSDPNDVADPLDNIDPRDEIILDRRIDQLIAQWLSCPDMLFAVNPIDGSLLVW